MRQFAPLRKQIARLPLTSRDIGSSGHLSGGLDSLDAGTSIASDRWINWISEMRDQTALARVAQSGRIIRWGKGWLMAWLLEPKKT